MYSTSLQKTLGQYNKKKEYYPTKKVRLVTICNNPFYSTNISEPQQSIKLECILKRMSYIRKGFFPLLIKLVIYDKVVGTNWPLLNQIFVRRG